MKALTQMSRSIDEVYKVLDRTGSSRKVKLSFEGESDPATETELASRLLEALDKPF